MADVAEEPQAPAIEPLEPITTAPSDDVKVESEGADSNPFAGLLNTLKTALKRQREETDSVDQKPDEKRQKTDNGEPEVIPAAPPAPTGFDIGAMLQNALGSFDEPQLSEVTAAADGENGADLETTAQAPRPAPGPIRKSQKKKRFFQDPINLARTMGLPLLGPLAVQILEALSERSREETVASIKDSSSDFSKTYRILKASFDAARRIFSESAAILRPDELDIKGLEGQETIQMANMATICASLLEADDVPLIEIHEYFLMTFLPESGALSVELSRLYLSLKTQLCVGELSKDQAEEQKINFLDRIFPANLGEQLRQLHPDSPLSEEDTRFVTEAHTRKESIMSALKTDDTRKQLAVRYPLNGFRDELSSYLQDNVDFVLRYAESHGIWMPENEDESLNNSIETGTLENGANGLAGALQALISGSAVSSADPRKEAEVQPQNEGQIASKTGIGLGNLIQENLKKESLLQASGASNEPGKSLASLITEKLGQNHSSSPYPATAAALERIQSPYASHLAQYQQNSPFQSYQSTQLPQPTSNAGATKADLPPDQTYSTPILYLRARQAAAAKSSAHARREGGGQGTRRPWSPEEEQALMTGLDMVKGPHWSQILQLFGPNGSISSILKDRNQVQLKDKARNLKLFFLKTNSEMPFYLKQVTGELKTRAPSQALKKEQEERARMNSEEEQARVQGIATLAALHSTHPTVQNGNMPRLHPPQPVVTRPAGVPIGPVTTLSTGIRPVAAAPAPMAGFRSAAVAPLPAQAVPRPAQANTNLRPLPTTQLPMQKSGYQLAQTIQQPIQKPIHQLVQQAQPVQQPANPKPNVTPAPIVSKPPAPPAVPIVTTPVPTATTTTQNSTSQNSVTPAR